MTSPTLELRKVRAVFSEGQTQHDHIGTLDGGAALDHLFDGLLGDVLTHAVVDAATRQMTCGW